MAEHGTLSVPYDVNPSLMMQAARAAAGEGNWRMALQNLRSAAIHPDVFNMAFTQRFTGPGVIAPLFRNNIGFQLAPRALIDTAATVGITDANMRARQAEATAKAAEEAKVREAAVAAARATFNDRAPKDFRPTQTKISQLLQQRAALKRSQMSGLQPIPNWAADILKKPETPKTLSEVDTLLAQEYGRLSELGGGFYLRQDMPRGVISKWNRMKLSSRGAVDPFAGWHRGPGAFGS